MDARADKLKAICSPLFKVGGIKKWWEPQYLANPPNLILSGVTHYTFAKKLSHLSNLVSQMFLMASYLHTDRLSTPAQGVTSVWTL